MGRSVWRWFRLTGLMILGGGVLMQVSCSAIAQEVITGLSSAIANSLITNFIYDALNVSQLSGLAT